MARYVAGAVDGQRYWHTVDEEATKSLQNGTGPGGLEGSLFVRTVGGFTFGRMMVVGEKIPENSKYTLYPNG